METNESQVKSENVTRKGLHKFFHVSRTDKYVCGLGVIVFWGIVVLKATGWEISLTGREISFISWTDAFQIGMLWGIAGIVLQMYYRFFEERYDK